MFEQYRHDFRELPARKHALERAVGSRVPAPHQRGNLERATKAHSSEAIERFAIVGLGWKEQPPATGLDDRRILEQRRIMALHVAQMNEQGLRKSIPVGESGKPGKPLKPIPIGRQGVGLLVGHHLQSIFDHAQKTVSSAELIAHLLVDPAAVGQRVECF